MKISAKIALSGVMTALSITLLYLGGIMWIFCYIMPQLCALLMIAVIDAADKKTAALVYAAVSIISIFAVSDKETVLTYIFFFGFYPIIRDNLMKIKSKWLSLIVRFIIFNAGIIASQLILVYVFGIPFDEFLGRWGIVIMLLLANLIFIMFDRLYYALTFIYMKKIKPKIEKYIK